MTSRLSDLHIAGQAAWLDFVDRRFLEAGGLRKLIAEDDVTGVTSNPSIFEKAMGSGDGYDAGFAAHLERGDASVMATYEAEAIADVQSAADDLRQQYDLSARRDGYVSLEVSPYLANDTEGTIAEARRLWSAVGRPNLMVKVPGTSAGIPAVRQLIEDGINVNVTLLFSRHAYEEVLLEYVSGLEARVGRGEPIDGIASVASFFVSRIDAQIDKAIDARLEAGDADAEALKAVRGEVAIANAKLAYHHFQEIVDSPRWRALAARGAGPQRLLWASTGTKDPTYADTRYVDGLIGTDTVNTMPPKTLDAFRDHGTVRATLVEDVDAARGVLAEVERLGLNLGAVTDALVEQGVRQFSDAFDALLAVVAEKRRALIGPRMNAMTVRLPERLASAVEARLEAARSDGWSRRLWAGDATLWTDADEAAWLGWLPAAQGRQVDVGRLDALAERARQFDDAVLLGMGGSSLGPEVLSLILGSAPGAPRLHVLDTTDPEQIGTVDGAIDPERTLFIVSSKSGSTMEPELLRAFFYERSGKAGDRFVAVTDPGSKLEAKAAADGFLEIFPGDPAIGGRYSVLSAFGMVPAAVIGVDVAALYAATAPMVLACGPDAPPSVNPGLRLGAILGEAAVAGRDKLTIVPSASLVPFGAWLEQLIAESTGKQGRGIVPVDLEPLGDPDRYGDDRLFAHFHLEGDDDHDFDAKLEALARAGHPVVSIQLADRGLIGQEFFRWEIATAVAGAVIGINPFNQPDVEDAKIATRKLVDAYEQSGTLDPETPLYEDAELAIFAPAGATAGESGELLAAFVNTLKAGDYFGILAYVERDADNAAAIARMRLAVRDARKVATVGGFGPRFLHSTGQAYKGGPSEGAFLEITRTTNADLSIPGHRAHFGTIQLAQARGDLDVLASRGQRVLRVHLKSGGLTALEARLATALAV